MKLRFILFAVLSFSILMVPVTENQNIYAKKKKQKKRRKKKANKTKKAVVSKSTSSKVVAPKNKKKENSAITSVKESKTGKLIKRRVVILNFVNVQKAVSYEYLSVSIPESIATSLDDSGQFEVLPRDVGAKAASQLNINKHSLNIEENAAKIARLCKADVAVIGQFMAIGSDLRIQARAVDATSGRIKVRKSKSGKTDASMFTDIEKLGKEMAAKMSEELPLLEQRLIEKERTVYAKNNGKQINLLLALHSAYSLPLDTVKNTLAPSVNTMLSGDYQFLGYKYFTMGGVLAGSFIMQKHKSSFANTIDYKLFGFWGGIDLGIPSVFHKPLSFHVIPYAGYSITLLKNGGDNKNYDSSDLTIMGTFEIRYMVLNYLAVSLESSYYRVMYQGSDLSEMQVGLGVGYRL